ncbi:MAG: CBS domain-containing protein [Chloroflexota bacterium]
MQIITSHERADMDALASMYAAYLLYPDHQVVLPNNLNRNLRDFIALYKDRLPFVERRALGRRHVSHMVLVDAQAVAPFRGMNPRSQFGGAQVQVIDHHAPDGEAPANVTLELDQVGACTTLLVERLRASLIKLDVLGASLLLMGIYEDTGSLSYMTTTARDAYAAGWVLEQGADLELVHRFLRQPLTPAQRATLEKLLSNSVIHGVHGRAICIASVALDAYLDELAGLIHPILDTYEPEACFLLAEYEGCVQIIARSATEAVDVAAVLAPFGGGGHAKAAAGRAEGARLDEVADRLIEVLRNQVVPTVRVREIMSTNVHTLGLEASIREAAQLMRRYGHEGFPVVDGEQLVGIVTRSDVDRALHHNRGELHVRTILHTGPLHVSPDDPVSAVQRVMIEHSLGQVPVAEGGRFIGIVTRTDLIKLLTPTARNSHAQEIRRLMGEALPAGLRDLLTQARDVANDQGASLYVVGGFVRDLLLGAPNLDLDLVVEGDAIRMAQQLAARLGARVRSHGRFGTAKLILGGDRPEGVPEALDFVTARTEFYERPSVLPTIERSSIKQDLYRRDFTINTLAICLDRSRYGELLDFYGGVADLNDRRIRVLHNLSFVEDPTRILRAVRFEQRLDFAIEDRTAELIGDALELIEHVTGEHLRHELYLILEEAQPERSLERLGRLGVLERLHPALRFGRDEAELFARLRQRFENGQAQPQAASAGASEPAPDLALGYLALLTSSLNRAELAAFAQRLRIRTDHLTFLDEVASMRDRMDDLTATVMLPSAIYRWLHGLTREARFVLSVLSESDLVRARLDLFERELAHVTARVNGHSLRALGVPPGPIYGEILGRIRDALLDKQISTFEEEEQLARALVVAAHTSDGAKKSAARKGA